MAEGGGRRTEDGGRRTEDGGQTLSLPLREAWGEGSVESCSMQRSWLIVPASDGPKVAEAAKSAADAVVLDLVELVADKGRAREAVRPAIESFRAGRAAIYAQVDANALEADLDACAWPGLAGVVISRAESALQVQDAARRLDRLEKERGVAPGVKIVAAVETAPGNHAAHDIARSSPRVTGLTLGRADLVMDLRPEPSGEIHLMPYLMQRLVIVAGAAGVTPIGAWWRAPDRGLLATPDHTRRAAERGRAIGFKGAMCLRPDQVAALNQAYGGRA
jgi:citrate lyase subunit beta/citryl-CoA lyase